ncbi:MAG: hypothetical protein IT239_06050, partial [Bacteroidia bacterium]|nr:hypothetical protein [Bacteroidia bacterium]
PEKEYKKQLYKEYLYNKNFLQKNLIEIVEDIINSYITQQNPFNAYTLSFLDLVQEFVNNNQGSGIELFLEFWETKQNKLSINLPPGGNAIQLLTIHKSKGLEFPYVLLPFANWEIKQQSNTKWVNNYLTEIDLPCYLLNLNKNLKNTIYEHFYIEEKDKSLLDNINLLYVAFTRAENGLIVITEKEKPKETKEDVSIKYIHQILNQSFIKGLINDKGLYEVGDIIPSKQKEKTPAYLSINFYSHKLWNEKINIKAGKEYDEDWTTEYQIRFGEAFHLFIEYYFKTKNLEKSLLRITSFGYEVEIINRITDYFEQLNKHAEFSKWVNQYMVYAIEQDILIPNGTAYRPDLVLIKDRNTIVIDFKTGEKLNKHQEQVSNYKNLIKEITKHENVTGALVYVHQNSIEILNA